MTAATLTLTEFLLARIAENEADAKAAQQDEALLGKPRFSWALALTDGAHSDTIYRIGGAFNPARVLAECEAKRKIVTIHVADQWGACSGCGYSGDLDDPITEKVDECPELRAFAAVYADHPDYNPAWT